MMIQKDDSNIPVMSLQEMGSGPQSSTGIAVKLESEGKYDLLVKIQRYLFKESWNCSHWRTQQFG